MKRGIVLVSIILLLVIPIVSAGVVSDFMDKFMGLGFTGNRITGYASLSDLLSTKISTPVVTTQPTTTPIITDKTITTIDNTKDISTSISNVKSSPTFTSTSGLKTNSIETNLDVKKIELKQGSHYFNNNKLQLHINSIRDGKAFAKIVKDVSSQGEITDINGKCYRSQPIEGGLRLINVDCPSNFGVMASATKTAITQMNTQQETVALLKTSTPAKTTFFSRFGGLFR
jgi:hypothetical protein